MSQGFRHTTRWGMRTVIPLILGMLLLPGVTGCEMPSLRGMNEREDFFVPSMAPRQESRDPVSMGHEEARPDREVSPSTPEPVVTEMDPGPEVDSGALAMIQAIKKKLRSPRVDESDVVTIVLTRIRNFSRTSRSEYEAMLARLIDLLNQAGADQALHFTIHEDEATGYLLSGSAYLLTNGGDQWELFLTLKETQNGWVIWEPSAAVHLTRHHDGVSPQLIMPTDD